MDKEDFIRVLLSSAFTFDEDSVTKWVEENKCDCCSNCKRKW